MRLFPPLQYQLLLALILAPLVLQPAVASAAGEDEALGSEAEPPTAGAPSPAGAVATEADSTDNAAPDAESTALTARAVARWQALIANRYAEAYEGFVTPEYRAAFSQQHFYRRHGMQVLRDRVEVQRIDYTNPEHTRALVTLKIFFRTEVNGELLPLTNLFQEGWAKVDGEWYLVPEYQAGAF